jgi:PD-(D/E)XK nuclease superfamily
MEWNISKISTLLQCHRKFYFNYEAASFHFAYPLRRKAYELSKMQSLKMWQGSLVDYCITNMVVPIYRDRQSPDYNKIANDLVSIAKKQFAFSANGHYKLQGITKNEVGADFLILDVHENGVNYLPDEVEQIYKNIYEIIVKFPSYESPDSQKTMHQYLSGASFLRPDVRYFAYDFDGVKIKPQIDLVRHNGKTLDIIDWKVSAQENADYSKQLTLEAIVTYHCTKKWYLDRNWTPVPTIQDVKLYEVNLLHGTVKQHPFNKESAAIALDEVYMLRDQQERLSNQKKWDEVDLEAEYIRTDKVETCAICKFRGLCTHMLINNFIYDEDEYYKLVQDKQLA